MSENLKRAVGFGEERIEFSVKRSRRRRSMALFVDTSGAVVVYAPTSVWSFWIDRFVGQHRAWIFKKLSAFKGRPAPQVVTPELKAQYIFQTQARLPLALERYSELLGVRPVSVKVANQTRRWGSCSSQGKLRFSWRMAPLPNEVFDYIVIHELAHLLHLNHSPRFWSAVASVCPDFKSHRKWLRKYAL